MAISTTSWQRPAAGPSPTIAFQPAEQVGATIGRYKLLEQIGEGGMGVVYVAEQTEPVRRRVALKIIKPGMDTRQVIARFEAERQALAMMDHPNIAKVLDGDDRAPVDRRTLDRPPLLRHGAGPRHADHRLLRPGAGSNPRGRLELFMTVCQAVQHAHQKGIIHRDIKPTNVLVTLHDGQPVVKVIDFGVAKAVNQQLTERTIYTAFTEMIGTPLYMSPEQAELSGLDVDTRSDVYSLGVLLYELLTGQTPFDRDTLVKAGLDEIRRMIREDEPPRPSHRISTLKADAGSTVSQQRGIDQRQLTRALARRARLDRDEGPRKRPQPPLRIGQRLRRRHRALLERRTGRGLPALGPLSLPQIRPTAARGAGYRNSDRLGTRYGGGSKPLASRGSEQARRTPRRTISLHVRRSTTCTCRSPKNGWRTSRTCSPSSVLFSKRHWTSMRISRASEGRRRKFPWRPLSPTDGWANCS